ncbi:MAG: signal peptidase I [Dehalococcoidia bacterium]|nr:signal peptidase I [Dehalococcoidia bacterium]
MNWALRAVRSRRLRVVGLSMTPTLAPGEVVLAEPCGPHRTPETGEVVWAREPGSGLAVVKRVVAGPGDTVVSHPSGCWVNGQWWGSSFEPDQAAGQAPEACGPAQYYLLGDNPLQSTDSRSYGPAARGFIEGRVWLVVWPVLRFGRVPRPAWFDRDPFLT